jgi:hypothetical protein
MTVLAGTGAASKTGRERHFMDNAQPSALKRSRPRSALGLLAAGAGALAGGYAMYAAITWCRYGAGTPPRAVERDRLLDRFMPIYDVVERHSIHVAAPAQLTLAAAIEQKLFEQPGVRLIVRARERIMGASGPAARQPRELLAAMRALGWGTLAEIPGREIVMGAVTKPWNANVSFQSLPPDAFASFVSPGFVKIAWTLRADPVDASHSMFRTETRAVATDAAARARFRRYWAFVSPGITLIRWLSLGPLKRDAERRATQAGAGALS